MKFCSLTSIVAVVAATAMISSVAVVEANPDCKVIEEDGYKSCKGAFNIKVSLFCKLESECEKVFASNNPVVTVDNKSITAIESGEVSAGSSPTTGLVLLTAAAAAAAVISSTIMLL